MPNRFLSAIRKGITGVQNAYEQQRKAAEDRAKRRMAQAATRMERERIQIGLEMEKLKLQKEMYEAKAAVQREREKVAQARNASGVGLSRRVSRFMDTTRKGMSDFRKMQDSFYGSPPRKRKRVVGKRKTTNRTKKSTRR